LVSIFGFIHWITNAGVSYWLEQPGNDMSLSLCLSHTSGSLHHLVAVRAFISKQQRAITMACENSLRVDGVIYPLQELSQDSYDYQQLSWTFGEWHPTAMIFLNDHTWRDNYVQYMYEPEETVGICWRRV
jgi:hypothetical protein